MTRVHVHSQGCSANIREGELMAGLLEKDGYDITENTDGADVHVVNICTVKKDSTPIAAIRRIKRDSPNSKIVVTGCITDTIIPKIQEFDSKISFANTHNFDRISEAVSSAEQGEPLHFLGKRYESKVDLPSVRKNPVVGIIPILNGCNYFCTFCSTKLVKGKLVSYDKKDIKEDMKRHLSEGCKEIWITSNDTGAYMVEQGEGQQIAPLLRELLSVPKDFWLRVGMMNPGNTLTILDDIIQVYKHPKMFKFLHIPLQAGNDEVLRGMNRRYTVEQFRHVVDRFKEEIPDLTLSTDIIVGFPEETNEQFQQTLQLCKDIRFDVINISRYAKRDGTVAAKSHPLPTDVVKDRSRALTALQEEISAARNKRWLGWEGEALVDEKGKGDSVVARNHAYKPIILKERLPLGERVRVRITETTTYDLRAEIVG